MMADKTHEYTIRATLTLTGALMVVDATSAKEAREIAEQRPDFDTAFAELTDWEITSVEG